MIVADNLDGRVKKLEGKLILGNYIVGGVSSWEQSIRAALLEERRLAIDEAERALDACEIAGDAWSQRVADTVRGQAKAALRALLSEEQK